MPASRAIARGPARPLTRARRATVLLLPLWLSGCDLVLGIGEVSPLDGPDGGSASQAVEEQPSATASGAQSAAPSRAADAASGPDAGFGRDAGMPDAAVDAAQSDDDAGAAARGP